MISHIIKKKIALITSDDKGIGLAVSKAPAIQGYLLILAGREIKKLEKVAKDIGNNAYPLMTDISNPISFFERFSWIKKNGPRKNSGSYSNISYFQMKTLYSHIFLMTLL